MENTPGLSKEDEQMELPPGFRFHPTDEELISQYLFPKVLNNRFCAIAIGEVDLNKCEPWDLPWRAKMGENEWYFFCVRDKKYPTGLRTNRATDAGYWKATGKDREILKAKTLVGMKKTLVFYKGRAPKGEKTNWVMHEYRLEGKYSVYNLPKTAKNEWVLCRIFQKSSSGKKTHISGLVRLNSFGNELRPSLLPPLMESHSYNNNTTATIGKTCHVTCFSDPIMEDQKTHEAMNMNHSFNKINICPPSNPSSASFSFPDISFSNSFDSNQVTPSFGNLQYPDSVMMPQDQSILRMFWENQEPDMKPNSKAHQLSQVTGLSTDISSVVSNQDMVHRSFEDKEDPSSTAGSVDLDSLGLLRFGSGF